ncbi:M24 family metallopeptidase [Actinopolymorpha rutila]|uniref:Xaa-Pro aminopeptidase n=1 Tax=Actinopolymorpha rutila TaxID=446787 RepID=A0A852ZBU5_9ACTN|nr:Xaa-Pro aminopeptidase [Actinopolymorpha rutila]
MPDIHAARRARLRDLLAARDVPAALITHLVNVRYLSGFTGSNAALLVRADGTEGDDAAVLATDGRYADQSAAQCPDLEIVVDRQLLAALARRAAAWGVSRLGVETHSLTVDALESLRSLEPGLAPGSLHRAVEGLRVDKDHIELDHLRQACAVSTKALADLFAGRLVGRSEREIARDLEARMFAAGAEALAFDTIVAGGEHSAIPHHHPTDRLLAPGDFLKIDFGARYEGYHADCTRTVVVGAEPADWQREIHDVVRAAQRAGRHALTPGVALSDVDAAARDVIDAAGYGDRFTHGLGHGVGLEIHEDPFFARTAEGKLGPRTPVTIEPGVYLPGRGGVRIEDTLIVHDGEVEVLTQAGRDLLVLA